MSRRNTKWYWMEAEDNAAMIPSSGTVPTTDPNVGSSPDMQGLGTNAPTASQPNQLPADQQNPDLNSDPNLDKQTLQQISDDNTDDFEVWKKKFYKLAVKGDTEKMLDSLNEMKDRKELSSKQKTFIKNNVEILMLRQDSNIDKASREIRKSIKTGLDLQNPGVFLVQQIASVLETAPTLNDIFIKLSGYYGLKGELFRKYIGALLGAIQVGAGGDSTDLVIESNEYSVNVSSRFYADFGEINLGRWSLQSEDPERYLSDSELERMKEGSPEEKRALRHRVIMESIAQKYKKRCFIISVVTADGNISQIGWDLGDSLLEGYKSGKLIVKTTNEDVSEAIFDSSGNIVPTMKVTIMYKKASKDFDDSGKAVSTPINFIELEKGGNLYLKSDLDTLREATTNLGGIFLKETPYQGNPSDIQSITRCIPSVSEMLLRRCQ